MEITALATAINRAEKDEANLYGKIFYQNSLGEDIMVVPCKTESEYEEEREKACRWVEEQVCMVSVRGVPSLLASTVDGERDAVESAGGVR